MKNLSFLKYKTKKKANIMILNKYKDRKMFIDMIIFKKNIIKS